MDSHADGTHADGTHADETHDEPWVVPVDHTPRVRGTREGAPF